MKKIIKEIDDIPQGCRLYIYGSGSAGRSLWMWLDTCRPDVMVLGFIDSFNTGKISGLPVIRFDAFKDIPASRYDLVLVASDSHLEISHSLEEAAIPCHVVKLPTYLMENLLPVPISERIFSIKIKLYSLFFQCNMHLFFGEHGGKFIGNNKYFFLYLKKNTRLPVYWVVDDATLYKELKEQGVTVLLFNGKKFLSTLLQASYFYFDNMTWQRKYPWLRHFKAKIIHMSHGVGLKMTEKMRIPREFMDKLSPHQKEKLDGKIFKNHLLVSTSRFYAENVSCPAYNTPMKNISISGYPKNDLFYRSIEGAEIFIDTTLMERVRQFKSKGFKIIVYAPTFRDMDMRLTIGDVVDYARLDGFLKKHHLMLIIKGHAGITLPHAEQESGNIFIHDNQRDVYPILKESALLITDYSSIYMDYLHHGRPVLFFPYDYDAYISQHREIQFDYDSMTPGPKAKTYDELLEWLTHFLIEGKDGFESERTHVLGLAFTFKDGNSCKRLKQATQNK